jgi:hypothetical protein
MHRGGGKRGGRLRSASLTCVLWLVASAGASPPNAASADSRASECAARMLAACPRGVAPGTFFFGGGVTGKRRAGFHAAAADPYLLDGLAATDLLSGIDGASCSAWLDWSHFGHALYREDRLSAAIRFPCPFGPGLRLYAIPAVERRAVRGFDPEGACSLSLAGSCDFGGSLCAGYACFAAGGDVSGFRNARAFLLVRAGSLALAVDRAIGGPRGEDLQCALEAWVGDRCAIVSGYRWATGEITSGLAVRIPWGILDFSWGKNPALGSTMTAGVGRLWEW